MPDKNKKEINWFNIITSLLSIVAIIVSYLSYQMSKQNFGYEVDKDSFMNTPAITEIVDSSNIEFKLNNSNAELQAALITFPKSIGENRIKISKKTIKLSKSSLEYYVKKYIDSKVKVKNLTATVGQISVPVVFDYSAIVFGFPHNLRENRALIFDINYYEDVRQIKFVNSFLLDRLGYPIKKHYFFTGPFSKPLEEKLKIQDSIDIQELLSAQLELMDKSKQ